MSRDREMEEVAIRLLQYADSPALKAFPEIQVDLRKAATMLEDSATLLREIPRRVEA